MDIYPLPPPYFVSWHYSYAVLEDAILFSGGSVVQCSCGILRLSTAVLLLGRDSAEPSCGGGCAHPASVQWAVSLLPNISLWPPVEERRAQWRWHWGLRPGCSSSPGHDNCIFHTINGHLAPGDLTASRHCDTWLEMPHPSSSNTTRLGKRATEVINYQVVDWH